MKVTYKMLGFGLLIVPIALTAMTSGKDSIEVIGGDIRDDISAGQQLERDKRDSQTVYDLVSQKGCNPVYGLNPRRNESNQPQFIEVPLQIGAIATIGGKNNSPFAPGSLLCDATGQVGRVGQSGIVESPLQTTVQRDSLPVIATGNYDAYLAGYQRQKAMVDSHQLPQAVISTEQELIGNRTAQTTIAAPSNGSIALPAAAPITPY